MIPTDQEREQDKKYKGNCCNKPDHHRMKVSCYPSAQTTKISTLKNNAEFSACHPHLHQKAKRKFLTDF